MKIIFKKGKGQHALCLFVFIFALKTPPLMDVSPKNLQKGGHYYERDNHNIADHHRNWKYIPCGINLRHFSRGKFPQRNNNRYTKRGQGMI